MARNDALTTPYRSSVPPSMPVKAYRSDKRAWEAIDGSNPVSLIDLHDGCRWPLGEPAKLFCNASKLGHGPYCPHHTALSKSAIKLERLR